MCNDTIYGRVLSISNKGFEVSNIAALLNVPKVDVLDVIQHAFAKSVTYSNYRRYES